SGWLRSALPGVVIDAPDEERGRRDRVVDATIYLVAFAISAATLADAWQMHPPWLRVVDVVVGIATLVSLHWRRTHPGAVGIGIGAVSLVILTASGANLAATFNAAIRARGRDLAVIAGLLVAWAFASPLLYPPAGSYWVNAGACLLVTGVVLGLHRHHDLDHPGRPIELQRHHDLDHPGRPIELHRHHDLDHPG